MTSAELLELNVLLAELGLLDAEKTFLKPKQGVIDLLIQAGPLAKKRKKFFDKLPIKVGDAVKCDGELMLVKNVVINTGTLKIEELVLVNKSGSIIGPVMYSKNIELVNNKK